MSETTLWTLDIDGSPSMAALDEIGASMQALDDQVSQLAGGADQLSVFDDILTAIQDLTQTTADGFANLGASIDDLAGGVNEAVTGIDELNASLDEVATSAQDAATSAQEAADSVLELGTSSEEAAGLMDGLQSAMGPLTMIAGAALMAGQQLFSMGLQGEEGFSVLHNMAGASQGDMDQLENTAVQLGLTMQDASAGMYMVESAGYTVANGGLQVFTDAEEAAKASGASAADETSALTSILHAYGASAQDAGKYTDLMTETIVLGKQQAGDFARAIGPLAAAGHNVGLSFQEVAAAEATMTQINPNVRQDTMQLRALFNALDPDMGKVVDTAKKLGLNFDEAHYKSLDLIGRLQYLSDLAGGTANQSFEKLVGGTNGVTAALDLLSNNSSVYDSNLQKLGNSAGVTQQAFQNYSQTVGFALDRVGAAVSKFAMDFVEAIGPKITPILNNLATGIGNFANFVSTHINQLMPVFAGLAALIGGAVIGAIVALLASVGPVLGILAGIGVAVGLLVAAFQHWSQIMGGVRSAIPTPVLTFLHTILQQIGSFVTSAFVPVWQNLVNVFNTQLKPAFSQLMAALQPLMPLFQAIAMLILTAVVIAVGLLIGMLRALVQGFANLLIGLTTIIAGIAKIFTGLVQIISGVVSLILDICTGNFNKLGADLGMIWQGIVNVFSGAWEVIVGIFQSVIGLIVGLVSGFIQGIIGFFTSLWDQLTGHSIIPDMLNDIVNLFTQLPGRVLSAVQGLASQLGGFFGNLASQALTWGSDIISNIASGISNAVGKVTSAVGSVVSAISGALHFSKPDFGPLRESDTWMPHFGDVLSSGLRDQTDKVRAAATQVATAVASGANPTISATLNAAPLTGGGTSGQHQQVVTLLSQIAQALTQIHGTMQQQGGGGALAMNNTVQMQGITNAQQFYNFLQSIGGYDYYQGLKRGAAGLG